MNRLDDLITKSINAWRYAGLKIPNKMDLSDAQLEVNKLITIHGYRKAREIVKLSFGIILAELTPDCRMICWSGDPRVKLLLIATKEQLPEFLTYHVKNIREMAKTRLDWLLRKENGSEKMVTKPR